MKNIAKVSMLALAAVIAVQAVAGEVPTLATPAVPVVVVNEVKPGYLAALKNAVVSSATSVSNVAKSAYTAVGSRMPASKLGKFGVAVAAVAVGYGVYSYRKEIKNFIKKHWGTLLVGAGAITAAVLAYKYGYIAMPACLATKAVATTEVAAKTATEAVVAAGAATEAVKAAQTAVKVAADVSKTAAASAAKDATTASTALDTAAKTLINIKDYTVKNADTALVAISNGMSDINTHVNPPVNN